MEEFNRRVPKEQSFKSAKAFGAFVRSHELPVTDSLHDANGKSRARCLIWDQRIEAFIKRILNCSVSQDATEKSEQWEEWEV